MNTKDCYWWRVDGFGLGQDFWQGWLTDQRQGGTLDQGVDMVSGQFNTSQTESGSEFVFSRVSDGY